MLIGKPPEIPSSAITSKDEYLNRRRFLRGALSTAVVAGASGAAIERAAEVLSPRTNVHADTKLDTVKSPLTTTGEELTSLEDIDHYNNFYEFGVDKSEPAHNAGVLPTRPWTVKVDGKVKTPKTFDIDALLKLRPLEDRVYRHRCVEAWSMVIPWVGYSLSEFIKACAIRCPAQSLSSSCRITTSTLRKWASESNIYLALLRGAAHG
jgi:sulfoxide reductase catalytic subunit YedY